MTVVSDSHYQSTLDVVCVYVVPWSEFPMVPSYPHYPHRLRPTPVMFSSNLSDVVSGKPLRGLWNPRVPRANCAFCNAMHCENALQLLGCSSCVVMYDALNQSVNTCTEIGVVE